MREDSCICRQELAWACKIAICRRESTRRCAKIRAFAARSSRGRTKVLAPQARMFVVEAWTTAEVRVLALKGAELGRQGLPLGRRARFSAN